MLLVSSILSTTLTPELSSAEQSTRFLSAARPLVRNRVRTGVQDVGHAIAQAIGDDVYRLARTLRAWKSSTVMTAWLPLFVQFVHPDYVRDVIPIRARGANMLFWFSRRGDQRRVGN